MATRFTPKKRKYCERSMRLSHLVHFATLISSCTGWNSAATNPKQGSVIDPRLRAEALGAEERGWAENILHMLEMLRTEASKAKQKVDDNDIITDEEAFHIMEILYRGFKTHVKIPNSIDLKNLPDDSKDHLKSKFQTFVGGDKERLKQVQKWLKWRDQNYSGMEASDLPAPQIKDRILNWLLQEAGKSDALSMPAEDPAITDEADKFDLTAVWEDFMQEKELSGLDNVPTFFYLDHESQEGVIHDFLMFIYEDKNRARQLDGWIQWLNSEPGRKKALIQKVTGSTIPDSENYWVHNPSFETSP
ncbi:hypothetical protein PsorP6_009251 [Peronosclerospora sorghi]|uniref:Uncharacterized protein n=1 Tax=Peronosclerospora sorghi TaxID=230839 RepID=A0ACC0W204_9STRA|nr:hypothetical protein PsorP6_009251 [Peronosclerospora sorghi]